MPLSSLWIVPVRWLIGLHHVFGLIGYVMLLIFLACIAWTIFLIDLQLFPNETANALMNTDGLDDGKFWQLPKADVAITMLSVLSLLIVLLFYVYLIYTMVASTTKYYKQRLAPRQRVYMMNNDNDNTPSNRASTNGSPTNRSTNSHHQAPLDGPPIAPMAVRSRMQLWFKSTAHLMGELMRANGKYRKIYNVILEVPECTLQALTLYSYLQDGLIDKLVYVYVGLILGNCLMCFYFIQIAWKKPAFDEIVADALADVVFTIVFPAFVLFYAVGTFDDDLESLKIRQQFFPSSPFFDRGSQLYADPKKIAEFVNALESLRILTPWGLTLRITFKMLTCLRWRKILLALRWQHTRQLHSQHLEPKIKPTAAPQPLALTKAKSMNRSSLNPSRPRRLVPRIFAWLFLSYGVSLVVWTVHAVRSSRAACAKYAPCQVYAHQWNSEPICPCLVYIDREMKINSTLWDHPDPPSSRDTVISLAKHGKLRRLELVNRYMGDTFPDEVEKNTDLRQLVLIHTNIKYFPAWTSHTFQNLQYLHLEGKAGVSNIYALPSDLFESMKRLHTLYLTRLQFLPSLPSFEGLKRLETLYLGTLDEVSELSGFDGLYSLTTLGIRNIPLLRWLPELTAFAKTIERIDIQRVSLCCSGYLDNKPCNTTNPLCTVFFQDPMTKCLPPDQNDTMAPSPSDPSDPPLMTLPPMDSDPPLMTLPPTGPMDPMDPMDPLSPLPPIDLPEPVVPTFTIPPADSVPATFTIPPAEPAPVTFTIPPIEPAPAAFPMPSADAVIPKYTTPPPTPPSPATFTLPPAEPTPATFTLPPASPAPPTFTIPPASSAPPTFTIPPASPAPPTFTIPPASPAPSTYTLPPATPNPSSSANHQRNRSEMVLSEASRRVLERFLTRNHICDPAKSNFADEPLSLYSADVCEGVLYRQCKDRGICYNEEAAKVTCLEDMDPTKDTRAATVITMRKEMIKRGIKCDPDHEAWLGCTA